MHRDVPWGPLVSLFGLPSDIGSMATPEAIAECKEHTPAETLCDGLPPLFAEFLLYARTLDFDEDPHYDKFKESFMLLAENSYKEKRILSR